MKPKAYISAGITSLVLSMGMVENALSDRGCEGDLYMKVTYSERHTGAVKSAYFSGKTYSDRVVVDAPTQHLAAQFNKLVANYPKEIYVQNMLGRHKFTQSAMQSLDILPDKAEQPIHYEVAVGIGGAVGLEDIRRIIKVDDFRMGCNVTPHFVSKEQFEAVKHGELKKVTTRRKFEDYYGQYAVFYDVEYVLNGKSVTFTLPSPGNPEGC